MLKANKNYEINIEIKLRGEFRTNELNFKELTISRKMMYY